MTTVARVKRLVSYVKLIIPKLVFLLLIKIFTTYLNFDTFTFSVLVGTIHFYNCNVVNVKLNTGLDISI